MRKIFLPLIIFLSFLVCESANAQIGGFCNASIGSIAITSTTGNGCPGNNSTTLTLSGTHVGSLQWLYSLDGISWVEIDGETGTSYTADDLTVTTRYALRATFTGISGTCSELSNVIVISIAPLVWYKDHDSDHYSDGTTLTQCTSPGADYKLASQLTATNGDCNDNDPAVHPGALEVFDGADNNCDGVVDEGFHDYIIPAGISSISLTVQGAKGGSIKRQDVHLGQPIGSPITVATGGGGARLNAKFRVETDCQQGLKPGGKLRMIIGATPNAITRNQQVPSLPVPPTSFGQGGGGGTAILYQAPGTTEWVVLAVAGGGGGAFSRADGLNSLNSPGIVAIQQSFDLNTTGPSGMGGKGFFITQEIPDGDPRDGGLIVTTNISGGGGGAYGDATQSCGGKKGMDEGGTSTLCSNGKAGGYGFGAGGSGLNRIDDESTLLSEEGGGGGGGGYSGGNGGENATGGFGGGSYVSELAFESSWLTSSTTENGSISIVTSSAAECCDPAPPVFTGDFTTANLGINPTAGIIQAALGTATATDACGAPIVTSTDGVITSEGCSRSRTRTFTAEDAGGNTSTASRTVMWTVDITAPTVAKGSIASCYKTVADAENAAKTATTYSDNCSANDQLVVNAQTAGTCSASITITVTDAANNSNSVTYTTKIDGTAPVLSSYPEGIHLNCTSVIFPLTITASDNCDGDVSVAFNETNTRGSDPTQSSYFNYTVTRRWSASDACGNTVAHTQIITVEDKAPPQLNCPGNMTVSTEAGSCYADVTFNVNAIEPCGMVNTSYYLYYGTNEQQQIGSPWRLDVGIYAVTVISADISGNSSNCTIALTINDLEKPTVVTKNITVQLNATGNASITDKQVDNGSSDNCTPQANLIFETNIKSFNCSNIASPVTVTLKVIDASGNTATSSATVTVEDKVKPIIVIKNIIVHLDGTGNGTITDKAVDNGSSDNCTPQANLIFETNIKSFNCSNIGSPVTVTLKVTDGSGNTASASATVTVEDKIAPTVLTKNITAQITQGGDAIITVSQVDNGSYDACGGVTLSLSKYTFYCHNIGPNTVVLTATDANGNTASATAIVTVEDHVPPTMFTKNIIVQLDADGTVAISPNDVNNGSYDACSVINYSLSKSTFNCSNIGPNTVVLKATDANGNTATANATVTVEDKVAPIALAKNITAQITQGGNAIITATQVDNGSYDVCGNVTLSLSKYIFICRNIGPNTVVLTATDGSGNTATATAIVTVEDHVPPTMFTKNITVQLSATGSATITHINIDNGSYDACGIANYSLSISTFNCSNVGPNTVILKATDANGNTATAAATVTVVDNLPPTVNTQNVTISLNALGQASVIAAQVNNNSTDNCSIPLNGYLLNKTSFDCSNVGPNTVILKVTDANNNTSTASATVTVVDNTPPTVNTQNATIYLNASGQATLSVAQVNNSSTDNCSIPVNGYLLSKMNFDCSNIGSNTVTLKVTDANNNTATATATVTVVDNIAPTANCKNIMVYLGTNGTVSITGAAVNNNSTDNCTSPAALSLSINRSSFNSDDLGSYCSKAFNVVLTVTDGSGNTSSCTASVTVKKRITKLVYNGAIEGQYSDPANLSATLYDITEGEPGVVLANKTINFTIGTQSVSDTYGGAGGGTNASGIANGTIVLNQDPTPAYTIVSNFAGDAVYCTSASIPVTFDIKPEDICAEYNGQLSVAATVLSKTSNTAKIVMSVGLADDADGNPGDVTKAKVEFNYGIGWVTVPVQALNTANTLGNATLTVIVNFSGDATTLGFEYRISGYYQINQECSDNGQSVINVYKPQGEFITGGGYIVPTNKSVGVMPADSGRKANFGFNVKYNQKNTNLQGNINYIFRRKENGVVRLYQVKGNSMTSLTVNMNDASEGGTKTAVFVGKCNVTDVTNPAAPVPVPNTGNSIMQVIVTDASESGTTDKYGITVWNSSNQLFHSSNWESTKTTKLVLRGGNIVVNGTTSSPLTRSAITDAEPSPAGVNKSTVTEKTEASVVDDNLKVVTMPNPSNTNFRITVNSNDLKEPVKLFVTDMLGRVIETRITNAGQTLTIGDKYISGTYAVRIMQGRKTKQLTLIKLSD